MTIKKGQVKFHRNSRGHFRPTFNGRSVHLLSAMEQYHVTTHIETIAKNGHPLARHYLRQEYGERHLRWIVGHP